VLRCLALPLLAAVPAWPGPAAEAPSLAVLGIAQDAGVPQAGCKRACCSGGRRVLVSSLALLDPELRRAWLFDATPDLPEQLRRLERIAPGFELAGVFLTHAHIGHYTGLMHFGREAMGARRIQVYAMPRMRAFLAGNGPWDQLVRLGNIELRALEGGRAESLGERLRVTPFLVPHRDEYSETVGFRIEGPSRSAVFIPDVDRWERWERAVEEVIASCDVAFLDGTFFSGDELPGRDLAEIPHPLIAASLRRFASLPPRERAKVRFIHLNHTNPALLPGSPAERSIRDAGCSVARERERVGL